MCGSSWITEVITGLLAVLLALFGIGCAPNDWVPKAFPQELGQAANTFALSMTDQTVWREVFANVDGNVQDPGVETYVQLTGAAGMRLVGVNGDVNIGGTGQGTGVLTEDARDVILDLYRGAGTAEQRKFILEILGKAEQGEPEAPTAPATQSAGSE